jgi:hypothetical protein
MGEPIVLHNAAGETVHVYTREQAKVLLDSGAWFASAADAKAGKVREEPTPATETKMAALEPAGVEGGAIVQEPDVTEAAPPAPAEQPAKRTATKPAARKK